MKKAFYFLLVFVMALLPFAASAQIDSTSFVKAENDEESLTVNTEILKRISRIQLKFGRQRLIYDRPLLLDGGYGDTYCHLFEVPILQSEQLNIEFTSVVHELKIYYPILIKLTEDFEIQEIIKDNLDIKGSSPNKMEHTSYVNIDKETRYILLTTDPALAGNAFTHTYEFTEMDAYHTGRTPIFVPSANSTQSIELKYTNIPQISVKVASANNKEIVTRENGLYFGLGGILGGEKVTYNPSFRVGAGATLSLGFSHSLFGTNLVPRYGVGFRYMTSENEDARNMGFFSEVVLTYQTRELNFGLGGQLETANSIKDNNGKITRFQPAFGPKVIMEYRWEGKINMGIEYLPINFYTNKNIK